MARKISIIQDSIIASKDAQDALSELNSPSQVAIWRVWTFIQAVAINLMEQAIDIYVAFIESKIAKAGAGTMPWIRDRILEFQAGDNVTYSNGVIAYPTVDTTKQILTRCSVTQDTNRSIKVKVAKSDPPAALSNTELLELTYYGRQIQFAGTQLNFVTDTSDKLYILGEVFYDGQFATSIQADVIAALDNYCSSLSSATNFNGTVLASAIETVILQVPGVKDVGISQIAARPNATAFASRIIIYDLTTGVNIKMYETFAGYIVQETDTGHTFADSLTFTAQ
jgi:hypothetical protein